MAILVPVILSGGAGSRLWPVSREGHPKPFMKLADGQTLIEKTYQRAARLGATLRINGVSRLLTVTNRDYYFLSRDELLKTGAQGSFLLEPFGRNTAAAIALAAHQVKSELGDEALMLVLAADHLIQNDAEFDELVNKAVELASQNHLVTFGIVPNKPATGFGYIESGVKLGLGQKVNKFIEKPSEENAKKYIASGNYFWNSGMFCFKASQFLQELEIHSPNVFSAVKVCWGEMLGRSDQGFMEEIPSEAFELVPDISIDHALMEKSQNVVVLPADIGWSDVGSWDVISGLVEPDVNNNRAFGDAIFVGSRNTFVQSEDRVVAVVGLENLMIIDTIDALLVVNANATQDVKVAVNKLKALNHDAVKLHRTVIRPWGAYCILEDGPGFKVKRIEVKPGASLSLQVHQYRSEHWVVVDGLAEILNGDQTIQIATNESTYIPAGRRHRLKNIGKELLVIIEVQSGAYLGEDDIVRFSDIYGRS